MPHPTARPLKSYLYKSCPRCAGDLIIDDESARGSDSAEYDCLQCGRRALFETHAGSAGTLGVYSIRPRVQPDQAPPYC